MSTQEEGTIVRRTIMAVALAAMLLVGCGSQDGDTGDSPSPPATTGVDTPAY